MKALTENLTHCSRADSDPAILDLMRVALYWMHLDKGE